MKNSIFGVFHVYDVDGGFGDAIRTQRLICVCISKEEATEVARNFSSEHVYLVPYAELECGKLVVEELPTTVDRSQMWWLKEESFLSPEQYKFREYLRFEDVEDCSGEPLPMASPEEMDTEWDKLPKFASFTRVG